MADYSKVVAWSGKDALADSDAAKVISGADFHTEFSAIETAVNTKADINGDASEAFSATTASVGTNTTQVATTAFVQAQYAYPVGAIFTTTVAYANSAAVVAAIGGTTWTAFGAGKVLVGVDASDTDFDTVEETGGAKTHTLTISEMPAHTHSYDRQVTSTDALSIHDISRVTGGNSGSTTGSTGGGTAHNNLQPYITVYMWKRTA
jgi:hypothetical protein